MDSESPGLAESFPTLLTLERLLFGVNVSKGRDRQRDAMFMNGCPIPPPSAVKVFVGTGKARLSKVQRMWMGVGRGGGKETTSLPGEK